MSITAPFLFGGAVEIGGGVGCHWLIALTHAPATFTFPAGALHPEAEVPNLAPSVGARGSELGLDPAPGVKVWCLGEGLGPALADPDLLSTCKADSHSARVSVKASPAFP